MNSHFKKVVPTISLLLSGCAAMMARTHYTNGTRMLQDPPYFAGAAMDIECLGSSLIAPFDGSKETEAWSIATFPLFLVDFPLSTVLDVLYIPSDYRMNRSEGWKRNLPPPQQRKATDASKQIQEQSK